MLRESTFVASTASLASSSGKAGSTVRSRCCVIPMCAAPPATDAASCWGVEADIPSGDADDLGASLPIWLNALGTRAAAAQSRVRSCLRSTDYRIGHGSSTLDIPVEACRASKSRSLEVKFNNTCSDCEVTDTICGRHLGLTSVTLRSPNLLSERVQKRKGHGVLSPSECLRVRLCCFDARRDGSVRNGWRTAGKLP